MFGLQAICILVLVVDTDYGLCNKPSFAGRATIPTNQNPIVVDPMLSGQWFLCYRGNRVEACRNHRALQRSADAANVVITGLLSRKKRCSRRTCIHGSCSDNRCVCESGWRGKYCGKDVNECGKKSGPCSQRCTNTPGSYTCACNNRYILQDDGHTCHSKHDHSGMTQNNHPVFVGSQNAALTGLRTPHPQRNIHLRPTLRKTRKATAARTISRQRVADVSMSTHFNRSVSFNSLLADVERTGKAAVQSINRFLQRVISLRRYSPRLYGGANPCKRSKCHHKCIVTTSNKAKCICRRGYKLDGTRRCVDVNECVARQHQCQENSICYNKRGGYRCKCTIGYTLSYNFTQRICIDINECLTGDHICSSSADCINMPGYHRCLCRDGYHGNGVSCSNSTEEATTVTSLSQNRTQILSDLNEQVSLAQKIRRNEAAQTQLPAYTPRPLVRRIKFRRYRKGSSQWRKLLSLVRRYRKGRLRNNARRTKYQRIRSRSNTK